MSPDELLQQVRRVQDQLASIGAPRLRRIHVTDSAVRTIEDWSGVRSPGRARRRRAKHPQRIRVSRNVPTIFRVEGIMYVHSEKWAAMVKSAGPLVSDGYSRDPSLYGIPVTFERGLSHADV